MDQLDLLLEICRARKLSKTPSLVISRSLIRQRVQEFCALTPHLRVFYSVKANPAPPIIRCLEPLDIGFEAASLQELQTLAVLGIPAQRIISSNPVKPPSFIKHAFKLGIRHFVFDSLAEAEKIAALAPGSAVSVRLGVDNSGSAWPLTRKYGVELADALDLLVQARRLGLRPLGTAFHVGSQCMTPSSWDLALRKTAELWRQAAAAGIELQILNVGGGFPAHHQAELPAVSEILESILCRTKELFASDVTVVAEPGRALVADAGVLLATVIGKARRQDERWLYLDIGVFNGMMEAVGGMTYTFVPLTNSAQTATLPYTLAGPSCDSFDVIVRNVWLPELEVGDRVAIYPGGAYTTAYASRFNGGPFPRIYLV